MEKKTYVKPELETVEFVVEAGFATSLEFDGSVGVPGSFTERNAFDEDDNDGWIQY